MVLWGSTATADEPSLTKSLNDSTPLDTGRTGGVVVALESSDGMMGVEETAGGGQPRVLFEFLIEPHLLLGYQSSAC